MQRSFGRMGVKSYAPVNASDHGEFVTTCTCCAIFTEWKKNHPVLAKQLQLIADQPVYYQLFPNEAISFSIGDQRINYKGTVRALSGAPLGECMHMKTAKDSGTHPYTCDACNAIAHGKSSVLNSYPPTVPLLEGQSRFLVQNLPLSRFFTGFLSTNLSLDLIIFSYFHKICKNVPLFDQKSHFFKNFVPLFASGRLVSMLTVVFFIHAVATLAY